MCLSVSRNSFLFLPSYFPTLPRCSGGLRPELPDLAALLGNLATQPMSVKLKQPHLQFLPLALIALIGPLTFNDRNSFQMMSQTSPCSSQCLVDRRGWIECCPCSSPPAVPVLVANRGIARRRFVEFWYGVGCKPTRPCSTGLGGIGSPLRLQLRLQLRLR